MATVRRPSSQGHWGRISRAFLKSTKPTVKDAIIRGCPISAICILQHKQTPSTGVLTWVHCGSKPICLLQPLSCITPPPAQVLWFFPTMTSSLIWIGGFVCLGTVHMFYSESTDISQAWRRWTAEAANCWCESSGF